ncbi:kit ligand a isoform X3 [Phycodurus eques]|uniref:kit ligand a isoform X3 n=1 Tax=Phycodurus eques TaxID=693459 RepID=UPI002ACD7594|nr:kit ligand a isoform X3 [Phycodurus eques]
MKKPKKHNIPKDYKIPVHYVPKEEGGMCWVKLNVFYLEESLQDLAHKFGNISSNRKDISIFIQMLQELRLNMGSVEAVMYDFECHFHEERWPTEQYFEFVSNFLASAQHRDDSDDCEPPPCPTTPPMQTEQYLKELLSSSNKSSECDAPTDCQTHVDMIDVDVAAVLDVASHRPRSASASGGRGAKSPVFTLYSVPGSHPAGHLEAQIATEQPRFSADSRRRRSLRGNRRARIPARAPNYKKKQVEHD